MVKRFPVSTSQPAQLVQIPDEKDTSGVDKVVVCLEDMFDCCSAIHKAVGFQGNFKSLHFVIVKL